MNEQSGQPPRLKLQPFTSAELIEVLSCVLHTIMFHRNLSICTPQEKQITGFGSSYTYVKCSDAAINHQIETKVHEFVQQLSSHQPKNGQADGVLKLQFLDGSKVWEVWHVDVAQIDSHVEAEKEQDINDILEGITLEILRYVNTNHDHIPPVPSDQKKELECYKYKIVLEYPNQPSLLSRLIWGS